MSNMFVKSCDVDIGADESVVRLFVHTKADISIDDISYQIVTFKFNSKQSSTAQFVYQLCHEKLENKGRVSLFVTKDPDQHLGEGRCYIGNSISAYAAADKDTKDGSISAPFGN